jgi:hypothetical protein
MEDRIPISKPAADLEQVYVTTTMDGEPVTTIRYITKYGKVFEREESRSRGVVER